MDHFKTVLEKLKKENLDGLIVFSPANASYLCGFESRDAYILISKKSKIYFTDARYLEEVKKQLKAKFTVKDIGSSFSETLSKSVRKLRLKRIGFESRYITYNSYLKLKSKLSQESFLIPASFLIEELRQKKSKEELTKILSAVKITIQALRYAKRFIKPGLKEIEIAGELERFIRLNGADSSAFDMIIASGPNSSFPHHRTGSRRVRANELVLVDIGVNYKGYKSDLTRIFFLGRITFSVRRIYDLVLGAQARALALIRPGVQAAQVDACARQYLNENGLGKNFVHSLGHGVGLEVHEAPRISPQEKTTLEEGMVITLEPAVYLPNKFGIRLEDMVLVTQKGAKLISGTLDK